MTGFQSDNTTGSAWVSPRPGLSLPQRRRPVESAFLAGDYAKADKRRSRKMKRAQKRHEKNQPKSWTPAPESASSRPAQDSASVARIIEPVAQAIQPAIRFEPSTQRPGPNQPVPPRPPAQETPHRPASAQAFPDPQTHSAPQAQSAPRAYSAPRAHMAQPPRTATPAPQRMSPPPGTTQVGRLVGVTVHSDDSTVGKMKRSANNFFNDRLRVVEDDETIPNSSGYTLDGVELTKEEYDAWQGGDPEMNKRLVVIGARSAPPAHNAVPASAPAAPPRPAQPNDDEDEGSSFGSKIFIALISIPILLTVLDRIL
ncbi:hypothetical protein [Trueperella bialowiezensis]|uniref:Uncharacterized protein n=1 Tax=Trueperella bialowiezensis TaxID=312285 RepID=A0A448PEE5_9ACTO|nr:hypothetical protein [Trueperella bialowiezensis]VEI13313.1 Uncharacterised protein [Trueperella bialowiezensis]